MRDKAKAVFARAEAESSKEKAEEEAYDLGVAETQATLMAQAPRPFFGHWLPLLIYKWLG